MTWMCMAIILLFLTVVVLGKIEYARDARANFFCPQDTVALRGFWCLIVVLVHIPAAYQNSIQDMIGSFGYIGVTFFFLISGYGLEYGFLRKKDYLKSFWHKHLPKLLLGTFVVNCISMLLSDVISNTGFNLLPLLVPNHWVVVLLMCYLLFWLFKSVNSLKAIRGGGVLHRCPYHYMYSSV